LIEAFRRGPYFEQMENGIYVRLTSFDDTMELMRQADEVRKGGRENDTDSTHYTWAGVDPY